MCIDCGQEIILNNPGYNGYSPVYANVESTCDGDDIVIQQLVGWINGTGPLPQYDSNYMTDAWLTSNALYLGTTGWVEIPCDAVNILGPQGIQGIQGSTGSQGTAGSNGEDGCDPEITLTVTVDGSEEYPATVTPGGTTCAPSYAIEFPTTAFTNNTTIDNHIEGIVTDLISPNVIGRTNATSAFTIGNSVSSSDIRYITSYTSTYEIANTGTSELFTVYSVIGNKVYYNFKINIKGLTEGTGYFFTALELKLPSGIVPTNNGECASVAMYSMADLTAGWLSPVIKTQIGAGSEDYLRIEMPTIAGFTPPFFYSSPGLPVIFQGQIIFTKV